MTSAIISIAVYVLVMLILFLIGYKKTKNASDYLVAGRKINPIVMALSYGATFISTSAIIGFGGAAGQYGMGLLWLTVLNIIVGVFIAFVLFGKRTRAMGNKLGAHTMPEFFSLRFGSKFMQGFAAILIFLFMPIYASAVLKGIVDYVSKFISVDFNIVLIVITVFAGFMVYIGGLKGIMFSDAFQGALMFAGMAFLIIYTYSLLGGVEKAHTALAQLPTMPGVAEQTAKLTAAGFNGWTSMPTTGTSMWWNVVTTLVAGVGIGVLAQPQLSIKFMTVKSNRELNRAVLAGGIFILFMTGVAFTVGALSNVQFYNSAATQGQIAITAAGGNDAIIPTFIKLFLPEWFGGIFLVVLLAASISTIAALSHTMGSALGRDFFKGSLKAKGETIKLTRIAMIIGVVISGVLAWLSSQLDASKAIIAQGTSLFYGLCAAVFLPSYIAALYIKSFPKRAAVASMVVGAAVSIIWYFFIQEKTASSLQLCNLIFGTTSLVKGTALSALSMVDAIVVALPLSFIVGFVTWGFSRGSKTAQQEIAA
jgi:solute:Na+ symporter, SSS family